jgi:hypothetical protein
MVTGEQHHGEWSPEPVGKPQACLRPGHFSGSQPANQRAPSGGPAWGGSQSEISMIKALFMLERVVQHAL